MNCLEAQDKIIDLVLGEISPLEKQQLQEHLEHCPLCYEEFKFLNDCIQICIAEKAETCKCQFQETYWDEFIYTVHERVIQEKTTPRFPLRVVLPIAASALAAIGISYFLFFRPGPEQTVKKFAPTYENDTYDEVYDLTPEEQQEFIKMINQRYGDQ
ncbi:hypothetical protein BXT86_00555 [candidate division WOR-3 bacterium 4484_100]|uniref:Putative zinc-finger domain-containing protein n=1 Tax=candidate division WOR-3 bacterium 4484_100 TaxID=1936077 RepID=A0A1V4QHR9_UNCW3|nr:MAG: hypothetical protein BXT86_00555 [candidate division WOR-3 bacterium 4484_100]